MAKTSSRVNRLKVLRAQFKALPKAIELVELAAERRMRMIVEFADETRVSLEADLLAEEQATPEVKES